MLATLSKCSNGKCAVCSSTADCTHIFPTGFCDTLDNRCKECSSNTGCSGSETCNLATSICGGCETNFDCYSATKSKCSSGFCTACSSHADCTHIFASGGGKCSSGTCKECLVNGDCSSGLCDTALGVCNPSCTTSTDCVTQAKPVCPASLCAGCTVDSQCAKFYDGGGSCKTGTGVCVQCQASTNCPSAKPECSNEACRGCTSNTSCDSRVSGEVCYLPTGTCTSAIGTECTDDSECTTKANPSCSFGTCIPCASNDNCDHLYVDLDGYCVGGICQDCLADGTGCSGATPLCDTTNDECVECFNQNQQNNQSQSQHHWKPTMKLNHEQLNSKERTQ